MKTVKEGKVIEGIQDFYWLVLGLLLIGSVFGAAVGGLVVRALLSTLLILVLTTAVDTQAATPALDYNKGKFEWDFNPAGGGTPSEFRMKCGPSTGNYTTITPQPYVFSSTNKYTMTLTQAIPNPPSPDVTTYFCVVAAANAIGEGPASNEVTFQAGKLPNGVGQLKVLP